MPAEGRESLYRSDPRLRRQLLRHYLLLRRGEPRGSVQAATAGHQTVLYTFTRGTDGGEPSAGVVRDQAGNLYGPTCPGREKVNRVVFQITPDAHYAAAGWNFTDTSFDTPGSCIVTPYIADADSIVFLECVITMN